MKVIIIFILLLAPISIIAQESKKPSTFNIEGQISFATNGKALFINFGGPSLKFHFSQTLVSVNILPSLKLEEDKPKPLITPIIGFGPQINLLKSKKLVLSFPFYYYSSKNEWISTIGIGYVFKK